jgi:hypothetical protein
VTVNVGGTANRNSNSVFAAQEFGGTNSGDRFVLGYQRLRAIRVDRRGGLLPSQRPARRIDAAPRPETPALLRHALREPGPVACLGIEVQRSRDLLMLLGDTLSAIPREGSASA